MSKYLLIESSEPWCVSAGSGFYGLAAELAALGNDVTLFLVQNAVLAARSGAQSAPLKSAADAGATVLADEFSLRERGIAARGLPEHVKAESIDLIVERLAAGDKAMWH